MVDLVCNLSDWRLLAKAESGDRLDFEIGDSPVHAEVLRRLMLGMPMPSVPASFVAACDQGTWRSAALPALPASSAWKPCVIPGTGIWIAGARIEGMLDLENGMLADNKPMPNLRLHRCDILGDIGKCDKDRGGIRLKSAHLRTLCLKGSHIIELDADYARFEGLLDISEISGFDSVRGASDGRLCRVSLRGAQLGTGLEAAHAMLVSHPKDEDYVKYSRQSVYALDLPEVRCTGDIRLFPDFTAIGGVNVNGADIRGSFKAHGAELTAIQLHALDASGAVVTGSIDLDARNVAPINGQKQCSKIFRCRGNIKLPNAKIGENLKLHGADIKGNLTAQNVNVNGDIAMAAFSGLKIADGVLVKASLPFKCCGNITIRGAVVGGDLDFRGAQLSQALGHENSLDATVVHVEGCARFDSAIYWDKSRGDYDNSLHLFFKSRVKIDMENARIDGYLTFEGAQLYKNLNARGIKVGGEGLFNTYYQGALPHRFTANGELNFQSAEFGLKLDLSGSILKRGMTAPELRVGAKLLLCGSVDPAAPDFNFQWFEAHARINLSGAIIDSDLDLTGAMLHQGLRFRGGQIKSALIVDVYNAPGVSDRRHTLDLFNASANVISDHCVNGERFGYDDFDLRLEGFTYGRFLLTDDNKSLTEEEKSRRFNLEEGLRRAKQFAEPKVRSDNDWLKMRMEWLALQYPRDSKNRRLPSRKHYNANSYNTLYKFLKNNGHNELAATVLHKKLEIDLLLSAGITDRLFKIHQRSADDTPQQLPTLQKAVKGIINVPFNAGNRYGPDLLLRMFRFFSGFGLNVTRTITWNILFILLITWMVYAARYDFIHKTFLDDWAGDTTPVHARALNPKCDAVEKVFFAISVYTPGVDLGDMKACSNKDVSEQNNFWRIAFSLWKLVGIIFVPLTALTVTGFFRRQAEP